MKTVIVISNRHLSCKPYYQHAFLQSATDDLKT